MNRLIAGARSAFYWAYEPTRLGWERERTHYPAQFNRWNFGDPLVSVILPTYNRADLLCTRALPSVLAQTYANLEIIVADHSSTDDTVRRLAALEGHRVRRIYVARRRRYPPTAENHWLVGPVDPLNAALKAARGAWVARCDDDDEWTPDHVEKLLRFAQAGNFEFVSSAYGRYAHYGTSTVLREVVNADRGIGGVQTWLYRSYLKFARYNIDSWRKRTDRVNDLDLAERFRRMGVRIGYLDEVTAIVSPRPGETCVGSRAYKADPEKTEDFYKFG